MMYRVDVFVEEFRSVEGSVPEVLPGIEYEAVGSAKKISRGLPV